MRIGLLSLASLLFGPVSLLLAQPVDAEMALVKRLIEALKDPDPDVRQNLCSALAKVGAPAVEPLLGALKDKTAPPERRAGVAYALGQIGPMARAAIPALLDALEDSDLDVRRQASFAISRLIPKRPTAPAPAPDGGKLP
jgi:HEAT repeat protein